MSFLIYFKMYPKLPQIQMQPFKESERKPPLWASFEQTLLQVLLFTRWLHEFVNQRCAGVWKMLSLRREFNYNDTT